MLDKNRSFLILAISLILTGITTPGFTEDSDDFKKNAHTSFADGKFVFGAEWLVWKAQEDKVSLAKTISGNSNEKSPDFFSLITHTIESDFKYTNGFRLTAGYQLPCESWEGNIIFTNLPTSARSKLINAESAVESIGGPFMDIAPNGTVFVLEELKKLFNDNLPYDTHYHTFQQFWNLTLNQVDLDLARPITVNDWIDLRPHAGFRWLWYTDKQSATFTGNSIPDMDRSGLAPTTSATFTSDASFRNKFVGYGIEGGIWADWQITEEIAVIGHFGGSILYSKFVVNEVINTQIFTLFADETSSLTPFTTTNHDTIHTATPTLDYFLGFQYADEMCDMVFALFIGWEQHVYFNTNRIAKKGDLSTQGLTFGFEVGF